MGKSVCRSVSQPEFDRQAPWGRVGEPTGHLLTHRHKVRQSVMGIRSLQTAPDSTRYEAAVTIQRGRRYGMAAEGEQAVSRATDTHAIGKDKPFFLLSRFVRSGGVMTQ